MNLITIKQFADRVGLKRQWIHTLILRGSIKAERYGKIWLIEDSEVEKFLKERGKNNVRS